MDVGGVASSVGLKGRNKEEEGGKKIEEEKKRCADAAVRAGTGQCR
jgi:hypothetical protein